MPDQKPTEIQPTAEEIHADELDQVAGGLSDEEQFGDNTGCANVLAKCG